MCSHLHPRTNCLDQGNLVDNAFFIIGYGNLISCINLMNIGDFTCDLCQYGNTLRTTSLKQLLDTRKTLCDISTVGTCHTTGMEGTHGQLRTWLTDRLGSHDSDSFSDFNILAGRHVASVTFLTYTIDGFTSKRTTDIHSLNTGIHNLLCKCIGNKFITFQNDLSGLRICDFLLAVTSYQTVKQTLDDRICLTVNDCFHPVALIRSTVLLLNDNILCYINQTTCQISRLGCFQGGIGQTFTHTVCGDKEFGHIQTLTETGVDRNLYDGRNIFTLGRFGLVWLCHQTTHTSQLCKVGGITTGTGTRHHTDWIFTRKVSQQLLGDIILDIRPQLIQMTLPLHHGKLTLFTQCFQLFGLLFTIFHMLFLVRCDLDIGQGYGNTGNGGILESHILDLVKDLTCFLCGIAFKDFTDDFTEVLLFESRGYRHGLDCLLHVFSHLQEETLRCCDKVFRTDFVQEREVGWEHIVEDYLTNGRQQVFLILFFCKAFFL